MSNSESWTTKYKALEIAGLAQELVRIATAPWDSEYDQRRRFILAELELRTYRKRSQ